MHEAGSHPVFPIPDLLLQILFVQNIEGFRISIRRKGTTFDGSALIFLRYFFLLTSSISTGTPLPSKSLATILPFYPTRILIIGKILSGKHAGHPSIPVRVRIRVDWVGFFLDSLSLNKIRMISGFDTQHTLFPKLLIFES